MPSVVPLFHIPTSCSVNGADGEPLAGTAILYKIVSEEEYDAAYPNRYYVDEERDEDDELEPKDSSVRFDADEASTYRNLKTYMDCHGTPPVPFGDTLTSCAFIQPTQEQLSRLSLADDPGEWAEIQADGDSTRVWKLSSDPINTTLRFPCPAFTVSLTPDGWLLYKGQLRDVGLHVGPELTLQSQATRMASYPDLRHYRSHLPEDRACKMEVALAHRRKDGSVVEGDKLLFEIKGRSQDQSVPRGIRQSYAFHTFPDFAREFRHADDHSAFSDEVQGIYLLGYSGNAPESQAVHPRADESSSHNATVRLSEGTLLRLTDEEGKAKEFRRSSKHDALMNTLRIKCVLPVPVTA